MFYCPGEFCSKKDICLHHSLKSSTRLLQLLDLSTSGSGWESMDEKGNYISHHEYSCGDRAPKYYGLWECKTWQDKFDYENAHNPAHAEGSPCAPGSIILIENEDGKEELIPFNPRTLLLSTKVLNWRPIRINEG